MSYLVLARKWRPQTFEDIIGQEHVTTTLRNAIKNNRLAHAYLFAGPRGVGKTTAARILAKAVNCIQGPTEHPCNECSFCREITASRSIDVSEIDGASNRGIDEIRELRESVQYTPAQGRRRVYIIDEVHMLTKEAFNALLKTLEEPPSHVMFIFATTEAAKVPATIMSRCQRFDFRRIATADMVAYLDARLRTESIAADEESLFLIAQKSEGSLRDAISLLDQMISYVGDNITAADVRQVLGLVDAALYFKAVDLFSAKDAAGALTLLEEVVSGGYDIQEFTLGLTNHLRRLLYISAGAAEAVLSALPREGRKQYLEQAGRFDYRDLTRMLRILMEVEAVLRRSSQPKLLLELAFIRLCSLDATVAIEDLVQKLNGGGQLPEKPAEGQGQDPVSGQQVKIKEAADLYRQTEEGERKVKSVASGDDIHQLWDSLLTEVKAQNMILGNCLEAARPVGLSDGTFILNFSGPQAKFSITKLENRQYQMLVEEQLARLCGEKLRLVCRLEEVGPQVTAVRTTREEEMARKRREAESIPQVKNFLKAIDGEII